MRKAAIYNNGILAGVLIESDARTYTFTYAESYLSNPEQPAIGVHFPKTHTPFHSAHLFPLFSNMAAEGANLAIQSYHYRIDERDILGLLGVTAGIDTIGSITLRITETT
jgi:serine/threonine-protein kinase HipA